MEIIASACNRFERRRGLYVVLVAAVICCGLGSRSEFVALPAFLAKYSGDALWALMIFLGFGLLLPARSTATVAGLAALVCVTVECSQLYHAPWIDSVRHTTLGGLILGFGFLWSDLACYALGVLLGVLIERLAMAARIQRRS